MIFPLITLIQDYSYDKTSKIVSYYRNNVDYENKYIYIHELYKHYNYRRIIPNTPYLEIIGLCATDEVFGVYYTGHKLPKRYIYSNMHI